jgi:YggT family protein
MSALLYALVHLIHTLITIYLWIIVIAALFSFVRPDPYNPLVRFIHQITEPAFQWVRRRMPFVLVGGMDLSPLVILLGLQFADTFLMRLAG